MEIRVFRLFILAAFFYSVNASLRPNPTAWSLGHHPDRSRMLAHLADMQVLLEFKQQVQQDPHGILATWMAGSGNAAGACSWHGVTCSPSQRVVKVELGDAHLEGPLMLSTLMVMDMLELVDLSGNHFHGNLTSGAFKTPEGGCGNLQTILLANNMIHGAIPSDLLACGNIQKLDLSHANLTDCPTLSAVVLTSKSSIFHSTR
ncbi:hypothetical protein GOP47_0024315 [Adiantum capillus-veneris]|uniref:Leucine-rich repeat-containing N-terminal plant-type domain-containing protein n=1 Tax=Adiantum capillus-veneris TaxID=13818 RepID=A0A9D4U2S6_ADICA|nr:hypothetical protein GOP47_0024315 [Adiantum capillus-veneris]